MGFIRLFCTGSEERLTKDPKTLELGFFAGLQPESQFQGMVTAFIQHIGE